MARPGVDYVCWLFLVVGGARLPTFRDTAACLDSYFRCLVCEFDEPGFLFFGGHHGSTEVALFVTVGANVVEVFDSHLHESIGR